MTAIVALVALLGVPLTCQADERGTGEPRPFGGAAHADLRSRPYEFTGAVRDLVEPGDIDEVRIGILVPSRGPRATAGRSVRQGATLAIAIANQQGGYRGVPFALVERNDDQIWGSAREVVALAYEDRVWAVLGSVGGNSSHVAEQVVTKAHLALVSPASSDASLTQIGIPWMFRCMPDDNAMAWALAEHLIREQGHHTIVGVAADRRDSRLRLAALEKAARRLATPLALSLRFSPDESAFEHCLDQIGGVEADAVVFLGSVPEAAAFVRRLAESALLPAVYLGPEAASSRLRELAGPLAEGLTAVVPCQLNRADPLVGAFAERYAERFGEPPDREAAYAYDGTTLLVDAVRAAGLNRARIRDALAARQGFRGVTGRLSFDGSGANTVEPGLVTLRGGRLLPLHPGES